MNPTLPYPQLLEKWRAVLDVEGVSPITNQKKRIAVAQLLENEQKAISEERSQGNVLLQEAPTNVTGSNVANWDPVLISMVRRSAPNLIAFDFTGVQPMTGPVGLAFALKARYVAGSPTKALSTSSPEALFDEADTGWSGAGDVDTGTSNGGDPSSLPTADNVWTGSPTNAWSNTNDAATMDGLGDTFAYKTGVATATGELFSNLANYDAANYMEEMGLTIERTSVTAITRALRAEWSVELAQDMKALHGLDPEVELSAILTNEISSEINREVIRLINVKAKLGAQQADLAAKQHSGVGGEFDLNTDADGRWSVEKYKGMLMQLERECNVIAKETRMGRGNRILCSSDVAAALNAAGLLDYTPDLKTSLTYDDTGNTYAGTLNGRISVYIDPYSTINYINVCYKGSSAWDAGMFYCPYVPLTPYRAIDDNTFQPKIAFKTRYGLLANPFAEATPQNGVGTNRANRYYRIFKVKNIL